MDAKQEEIFEVKQEELIIKDEYLTDPDPGSTSATPTEDLTESEDGSFQSETTSTISNKKFNECNGYDFNSSYRGNLKCRINWEQKYFCALCDFKTSRKDNLKQHMLTHSGEKPHHCEQCNFKTSHKSRLKRHLLIHSGEKPHRCRECDFKSSQRSSLKRHILVKHSAEKLHHCKQCDFKIFEKSSLKRHILLMHSGEKPHRCKQCDFKTSRKEYLKRHMSTHSGKEPHRCEQCDFKTPRKDILKHHMLTHSAEIPLHCEQCGFKTEQWRYLKRHLLTQHTGENSYHSGVTHSLFKNTDEDTKDRKLDLEIVPEECVVFNSMDILVKEEPNDSDL